MKDVPRDVAEKLRVMLVRIGRNLDGIGASKFAPTEPERFSVTLDGWCFVYWLDPVEHCVTVEMVSSGRVSRTG